MYIIDKTCFSGPVTYAYIALFSVNTAAYREERIMLE